jgi:hypothetical protein
VPLILPNAPQFSRYESNYAATPGSGGSGTSVSNYASGPHVKNTTFTQLIASTAFDAQLITIIVSGQNTGGGADYSTLMDIAIGAAASETVIIGDLCAGFTAAESEAPGPRHFIFPLYIPAGSRLSARTQSIRTSGAMNVTVQLYGGPRNPDAWWCGQTVTTYGANAANSAGTLFTAGSTGAEGTGVSLGTTTAAHQALVLGVQGHPSDVTWASRGYHFDVGIDSSSTEWFEADRFYANATTGEVLGGAHIWWPIYRPIPSGTELMIRGECSNTADPMSATIHGIS